MLIATIVGVLGYARLSSNRSAVGPARWHADKIVLFTVDTLRAGRLGVYGYDAATTSPHIDAWARDAVVFDRASAPSPWTVPSLAAFFTGRYPSEMAIYTNETGIPSQWATLAEILQGEGYRTAQFNSHSVLLQPEMGFTRGFDEVYPDEYDLAEEGEHKIAFAVPEQEALRWIEENSHDRFFLWVHDMDPHLPYSADNPYLEPDSLPYDAEVRRVDASFGDIVAHLQARGDWDDILFIFTADHGEAFGEHGVQGHQNVMYDEVLNVPLIIDAPMIAEPGRVREPVDLFDVRTTILDLAGIPVEAGTRGESLVQLLEGKERRLQRAMSFHSRYYFEDGHHELAVRDRRWKLLMRTPKSNDRLWSGQPTWDPRGEGVHFELYNLSVDPEELDDVANIYPTVVERLKGALSEWKESLDRPAADAPRLEEQDLQVLRNLGYAPDADRSDNRNQN